MKIGVHLEVLLAIGYAVFLALIALGLELLARHTQKRAEQYRIAGFKYHHHLDAWECPTGQPLHRQPERMATRIARYRAPAHACNSCAFKTWCTDSDDGREITRSSMLWFETEIGRFHRGISLALLLLAQFICVIELLRFHSAIEWQLLACVLAPLSLYWIKLLLKFRLSSPVRRDSVEP